MIKDFDYEPKGHPFFENIALIGIDFDTSSPYYVVIVSMRAYKGNQPEEDHPVYSFIFQDTADHEELVEFLYNTCGVPLQVINDHYYQKIKRG